MKKNIKRFLSSFHLKLNTVYKKLVCLTLVCSLVPLLLTSSISYYMAYSMSKNRTIDSLRAANRQIAININNRLSQVESLSNSISFYLYHLQKTPLYPLSEYLSAYSQSRNSIGSIKSTFKLLQITVFLPEDCFINPTGNGINFFPLNRLSDYNMTEQELFDAGSRSFWRTNKDLQFPAVFSATPKSVMTCWNAYRNIYTGSLNYAFACHLRLSEFSELLSSPIDTSDSRSYVIDQDNRILMHSDEKKTGSLLAADQVNLWDETKDSFIVGDTLLVAQPLDNPSMMLITQIPLSYVRQNGNFILTFLLLAICSIIICTVCLSIAASKTFTRRFHTLSQVMESIKASENRDILKLLRPMTTRPACDRDELDQLAGTYETMVLEHDEYFKQILEMSLQTEKLKYQLLQSQINPHFLFNTLNTIVSCQSLGKVELASQTITNLSQFYRHLLHDPDHLIPIREELLVTELYLKLICVSKPNRITWSFETEDGIEHFLICKFIFQPFMENAIIHAIPDSSSSLHIVISIQYEEDTILIRISDNGIGMDKERLADIRQTLQKHQADYDKNYGISNVNVRLTPYFAPGCDTIQLESHPGCGTSFTIHLKQIL